MILAGGGGKRLWPLSTPQRPKPFLPLLGGKSLYASTVQRLSKGKDPVWTVVPPSLKDMVQGGSKVDRLLVESAPRNTAAAVAFALGKARLVGADVVAIYPADHWFGDDATFQKIAQEAVELVRKGGTPVLVGVRPTHPHTGYGYIEVGGGKEARMGTHSHKVLRFHEKPDTATARAYVASGQYLWNTGMFFLPVEPTLKLLKEVAPALSRDLDDPKIYQSLPSVNFDKAVLEKIENLKVLSTDMDWSDVGSFHALWEVLPKDENGNAVPWEGRVVDGMDNLLISQDPQSILVGMSGMAAVQGCQGGIALFPLERDPQWQQKARENACGA